MIHLNSMNQKEKGNVDGKGQRESCTSTSDSFLVSLSENTVTPLHAMLAD